MVVKNDEEKRMESRTWYDDMCMWFALVMVVGGVGIFGYGAFTSISDYIKGKKHVANVRTLREQPAKPESIQFNAVLKSMFDKAK